MTLPSPHPSPLPLSFMSANYVAQELGYGAATDWGPFDDETNRAFQPVDSFGDRFDSLLKAIREAGFVAIDLWTAHLNWRWATPEHVRIARDALDRHGIRVVSLAGNFGATSSELTAACGLANELGVDLLGGMADALRVDPDSTAVVLRDHGVRFAYENHPENTPDEVLILLGDATDVLGAAVDTGWWATQGYDPIQAIRDLRSRLFYVHLKDVERAGEHVTCMHGAGCVDIVGCVDELLASGYDGALSIEHEPYDHDPTGECIRMREQLERHLATTRGDRP